jgi:hypothetical protein
LTQPVSIPARANSDREPFLAAGTVFDAKELKLVLPMRRDNIYGPPRMPMPPSSSNDEQHTQRRKNWPRRILKIAFAAAVALGGAGLVVHFRSHEVPSTREKSILCDSGSLDRDERQFAYDAGVQTTYFHARKGFSQGTLTDGRKVGLQFDIVSPSKRRLMACSPVAYNLDDPAQANAFQSAVNRAAQIEAKTTPAVNP